MVRKQKQTWRAGDIVAIPLSDGTFGLAQFHDYFARAMNSALCCITSLRLGEPLLESELSPDDVVSVQFVFPDFVTSGAWAVVGHRSKLDLAGVFDLGHHLQRDFIGTKVRDPKILENFLEAYFGLAPWDLYLEPDYFDKMLVNPSKRPKLLRYKSDIEH